MPKSVVELENELSDCIANSNRCYDLAAKCSRYYETKITTKVARFFLRNKDYLMKKDLDVVTQYAFAGRFYENAAEKFADLALKLQITDAQTLQLNQETSLIEADISQIYLEILENMPEPKWVN